MNKAMPIWGNEPTGVRVLRCAHVLESMGFIDHETVSRIEAKVEGRFKGQHHQMDFSNLPLSADPIRAELTALKTRVAELESTHPPRTYEQGAEDMRERAAKFFDRLAAGAENHHVAVMHILSARAIRALPTQPEGGGGGNEA